MTRNLRILVLILIGLAIFALARLSLFRAYPEIFAAYGSADIAISFLRGMRFDLSIFLTVTSIFWVLLLVPVYKTGYRKTVLWAMFVFYVLICLFLIVDVAYYGYAGRHLANEPFMMTNDLSFGLDILNGRMNQVAIFVIAVAVAGYFWNKFVKIPDRPAKSWKSWGITSVIWLAIIFILIRGSVGLKPISTIDAFASGDTNLGNLTLNGAFTSARFLSQKLFIDKFAYKFFDNDEAEKIFTAAHPKSDCQLPTELSVNKPNIVFIMLESWSAYYVDSFGKNNFGLTPNFDRLASEGIAFTRHYSPERRSISAIQAALTGIPPVSGLPSLGFGLETMASGNIGSYFASIGYDTIFVQSSMRRSFYMDGIAKSLGFKQYYGMEDTKTVLDYPDKKASVFGWDHETYNLLAEKLTEAKKPFFAFMFTGSTHIPYAPLPQEFMKYPEDREGENGFKNTLYYADWSLGQFFESIKNEPWFADTVFIITADHNLGKFEKTDYPDTFHVPLVIWSPKIKAGGVIDNVTGHVDIAPTLLHLGGASKEAGGYIGGSVFCKDDRGYAVLNEWNVAGIVEKDMFLRHSFGGVLDYKPENTAEERIKAAERLLLAYYQTVFGKVFKNR